MTAPKITPESFPYRLKFTQEQLADVTDRHERLAAAMTDAVGPTGQSIYVPPDLLHFLALHLALAGGDVQDRLAYIVSRPYEPSDVDDDTRERVQFAGIREWVLKDDYEPEPADPNETAAIAMAAADKIRRQLPPEVMEQLTQIFVEESRKTAYANQVTQQDLDEADALEDEMRAAAREEGDR